MRRLLPILLLLPMACANHTPVGFSSETTVSAVDLPRSQAEVATAIRDELIARGVQYEEQDDDGRLRFLFGRGQVVARRLDDRATRLEVRLLEYNGRDFAERADALRDAIVARSVAR